jgi:hypothetical protein
VPNEKRKPKRALLASAVTTGIISPLTQVWISTMTIPNWWKEANVTNSWNLVTTTFPRKVMQRIHEAQFQSSPRRNAPVLLLLLTEDKVVFKLRGC